MCCTLNTRWEGGSHVKCSDPNEHSVKKKSFALLLLQFLCSTEYASVIVIKLRTKLQGRKRREERKVKEMMPHPVAGSLVAPRRGSGLSAAPAGSDIIPEFILVPALPLSLLSIWNEFVSILYSFTKISILIAFTLNQESVPWGSHLSSREQCFLVCKKKEKRNEMLCLGGCYLLSVNIFICVLKWSLLTQNFRS